MQYTNIPYHNRSWELKLNDLSYENFKIEALKHPETKKEYEALDPVWNLKRKLISSIKPESWKNFFFSDTKSSPDFLKSREQLELEDRDIFE